MNITIPPAPGSVEYRQKQEVYLPEHSAKNDKFIVNIYRAIFEPPIEHWVKWGDPIAEDKYTLIMNLKIFSEREDLLEQFKQSQEIQLLMTSPEIATIIENSTIPQLLEEGRFHDILRHKDFHRIYEEPASAALISAVDWTEQTNRIIEASDLANHPIYEHSSH